MSSSGPLPAEAIQRVLFSCPKAHIYAVPPLPSNKGYVASQWTTRPEIFTARVRLIETATPAHASSKTPTSGESLAVAVMLEDPSSGELFAAAPYTHPSVITPCTDSTRFFAVRVVGDGGMKATLGMGFEERSEAFDFGVSLQEAGKVLGLVSAGTSVKEGAGKTSEGPKKDLSLKEGEMVKVNLGRRRAAEHGGDGTSKPGQASDDTTSFEIKGPPQSGGPLLPPPPSAAEVRREMFGMEEAIDKPTQSGPTAQQLGFDDGEFGEFQ